MNEPDRSNRDNATHKGVTGCVFRRPARLLALALAVLLACWMQTLTVHADDPTFIPRQNFGTGLDETWSVAVGDLDGDGDLDIVTGNYNQQNVVYLNDGTGHYDWLGSARGFGTGTDRTYSVALGDVDGDGDLDIVTGNYNQQNVVYLNDGTGHYDWLGSARHFGTGGDLSYSVALGDVDGDGDLDIVAGNNGQNGVYLNGGAGNFYAGPVDCTTPPANVRCFGAADSFTLSVALGDLNDDGTLDLVTGNDGLAGQQNVVYLNDRAGHFDWPGSARNFGTGSDDTQSVAVGDADGDGYLDIVVGNNGQNMVYLNNGSGGFSSDAGHSFGSEADSTFGVAVGDLDADGDLDIVAGNSGEQNVVYLNDGTGSLFSARNFGTGLDGTFGVALGDVDSDGAVDLVTGNRGQQNVIYLNDGAGHYLGDDAHSFGTGADETWSVALGDVDGDDDLDVVTGNYNQQNVVYLNDGTGRFDNPRNFDTTDGLSWSVALGDVDGDGDLDVVTGNYNQQNTVYLNDGLGHFDWPGSARNFGSGGDYTLSVALGDVNRDGYLDIVTGNAEQNLIYLNDGAGNFDWPGGSRGFGTGSDGTYDLALGDVDGDGHLDIVAGNGGFLVQRNVVYLNDGSGHFDRAHDIGAEVDGTYSVALGDVDGDGDLDVVTGNYNQQNVVYLNDGTGHYDWLGSARNFGTGGDGTYSVALGDMDGDGDLDIVAGNNGQNVTYSNDGAANFSAYSVRTFGTGGDSTSGVAAGDVDGDGDLDLVTGNSGSNKVYLNRLVGTARLVNNPPAVAIVRPGLTRNAALFSAPEILVERFIPISYTLSDPDGDPVGSVAAYYSLDGGGHWFPAAPVSGTVTTNLATGIYTTPTLTNTHVFTWDTFASGVFGQSDNVVFRLQAYPQPVHSSITDTHQYVNSVPGPFQRPYASATTFPFRIRGTQVRVTSESDLGTLGVPQPAPNALVYRLRQGQSTGGSLMADSAGRPFTTDQLGYLQGRGTLAIGDRLVATLPITWTDSYTLYFTSATPTPAGLDSYTVNQAGVQTLTVSSAHPLLLFNLDISLEWDARPHLYFMSRLQYDLQRTSEVLYDWTNGQAALGRVAIYQDRERWSDAHVRVYATNRLRPNATIGGVVTGLVTDPLTTTVIYAPGQVRMGAVWNRYGEPNGNLGEDWPRTLAHELGHYVFFLDDNYLGLDADGMLIPVETCVGAMSDPYRDDDALGYDEFHHGANWQQDCGDTLAAHTTGRWDWQTITSFYPWLNGISTNTGPNGLSLDLTQIELVEPLTPTTALEVPVFHLTQNGGRVQPGPSARAFLFQGDRLIDQGRPTLDQVLARGARPGDRVCVYELAAGRLGCETVTPADVHLELVAVPDWQPDVIVTPVTSRTVVVSVTHVPTGLSLGARLFSGDAPAPGAISLTPVADVTADPASGTYTGTFSLDEPALDAYVQVWVVADPGEPRREIVTNYALGGNPGRRLPRYGRRLPRYGRRLPRYAPAVSTDGQLTLFGENLDFPVGEFYALQAATTLPSSPPWATVVGQAYRLSTSANAPDLSGTSLNFSYLGKEVPPGEENWLRVYYWDGISWQPLPTRLDTYYNIASAPTQGQGLYALMSSLEIPLQGPGWDSFGYPVQETRPISEALLSISGTYTTVYGFTGLDMTDPWKIYDVTVPHWVNDLGVLEFGRSYWILLNQSVTLFLKGNPSAAARNASIPERRLALPSTPTYASLPATYYGAVKASSGFTPTAGMLVTAHVAGHWCGWGRTLEGGDEVVYTINVLPEGPGGAPGCGAPGRTVQLEVGSQTMVPSLRWDNNRVHQRTLHPVNVYLPLLLSSP